MIQNAVKNGCRQAIACSDLDLSEKTFIRWIKTPEDQRKGPLTTPANKLSELERKNVLKISNSIEYCDLPPTQIVPKLADKGQYIACESTFYRILKEENLLAHRGKSKVSGHHRPEPLVATAPNQVYSWDITFLKGPIKGNFFYLYMFMDVFSRKIVGYEVHENECMIKASTLIEKICRNEGIKKHNVTLHSDNGSAMKGSTMLATLHMLGVVPSFSRPSVSNDNPYSEALFKTLKYCPEFPSGIFVSIEAAREWVDKFVAWYNYQHLHSGIKFVTPADRHEGKDRKILQMRKYIYAEAKKKNPNRWSKEIRNWNRIEKVGLNNLLEEKIWATKLAS